MESNPSSQRTTSQCSTTHARPLLLLLVAKNPRRLIKQSETSVSRPTANLYNDSYIILHVLETRTFPQCMLFMPTQSKKEKQSVARAFDCSDSDITYDSFKT